MSKHIRANRTGAVLQIKVNVGDRVSEGTTVVILEADREEVDVQAEDDGIVGRILVRVDDAVRVGQTIVELE